jgi:hypothetical protein
VRKLNREQAKHLAETARLIAVAQFAAFGYTSIVNHQYLLTILSTVIFVELELVAVLLLGDK